MIPFYLFPVCQQKLLNRRGYSNDPFLTDNGILSGNNVILYENTFTFLRFGTAKRLV